MTGFQFTIVAIGVVACVRGLYRLHKDNNAGAERDMILMWVLFVALMVSE